MLMGIILSLMNFDKKMPNSLLILEIDTNASNQI